MFGRWSVRNRNRTCTMVYRARVAGKDSTIAAKGDRVVRNEDALDPVFALAKIEEQADLGLDVTRGFARVDLAVRKLDVVDLNLRWREHRVGLRKREVFVRFHRHAPGQAQTLDLGGADQDFGRVARVADTWAEDEMIVATGKAHEIAAFD